MSKRRIREAPKIKSPTRNRLDRFPTPLQPGTNEIEQKEVELISKPPKKVEKRSSSFRTSKSPVEHQKVELTQRQKIVQQLETARAKPKEVSEALKHLKQKNKKNQIAKLTYKMNVDINGEIGAIDTDRDRRSHAQGTGGLELFSDAVKAASSVSPKKVSENVFNLTDASVQQRPKDKRRPTFSPSNRERERITYDEEFDKK